MILETDLDPVFLLKLNGYENNNGNGWVRYVGKDRFHAKMTVDGKINIHFDQTIERNGKKIHRANHIFSMKRVPNEIKRIKTLSTKEGKR